MIILNTLDIGFGSSIATPYYNEAVLFMTIELLVYFTVYYLLKNKYVEKSNNTLKIKNSNNILYVFIIFLGILTLILFPEIRSRFNFITESIDLTASTVISSFDARFNALFSFSNYLRIIWPPVIIGFLYNKYRVKKRFIYILLSIILSFIPSLFYIVTSRNSIVLPAIASLFLLLYLYKDWKKQIVLIYSSSLVIAVLIMTISKSSSDFSNLRGIVNYLSIYFLGPKEYSIGLASLRQFGSSINFNTFINDMIGNVPIISSFSDLSNRTVQFYNYTYYNNPNLGTGGGFIIPMFIQFSFYLGRIISPLISSIAIIFIVKVSKYTTRQQNINRIYLVAYIGGYVALFYSNNISSLINLVTYTYIPLFLIDVIQNTVPIRRRNNKEVAKYD
jgi:hypothetical protein